MAAMIFIMLCFEAAGEEFDISTITDITDGVGNAMVGDIVRCNGWIVVLDSDPPNPRGEWTHGMEAELWREFLLQDRAVVERSVVKIGELDMSEQPPETQGVFSWFPALEGETTYIDRWMSYHTAMDDLLCWGDWIFDTAEPPPGYDIYTDPFVLRGTSFESTQMARRESHFYSDCWRMFFQNNPHIWFTH